MAATSEHEEDEDFPWAVGLQDSHAHPTDTLSSMASIPSMNATVLTIMATRAQDQRLVDQVARQHDLTQADRALTGSHVQQHGRIVPSFGFHPWFSHHIYDDTYEPIENAITQEQKQRHYDKVLKPSPVDEDFFDHLPEPTPLSHHLRETRTRLQQHPLALVGEVGLDRSFRLPKAWLPAQMQERDTSLTPGGRERRELSPYRVEMSHQAAVLLAQLRLAGELQRSVSVHGVRCSGILLETLAQTWKGHEREVLSKTEQKRRLSVQHSHAKEDMEVKQATSTSPRPYPPRICLHSYSGDPGFLKQYFHPAVPVDFYVSFSMVINFGPQSAEWSTEAIKATPDERLLIESDLHTAGKEMDDNLEAIARKVCKLKGWSLHHGVQQLSNNWHAFVGLTKTG